MENLLAGNSGFQIPHFQRSYSWAEKQSQRLYDLQDRRCFYSGGRLNGLRSAEVDHFIPWAR